MIHGFIVIDATDQSHANELATTVFGADAGADTFSVPLESPDAPGQKAAYWCHAPTTADQAGVIAQLVHDCPATRWYQLDEDTLIDTNSATAEHAIGASWTADDVLDDLGLTRPNAE